MSPVIVHDIAEARGASRWLPGFTRVVGEGSGTWAADNEDAPKIVLHTTEGSNVQAAINAYRANRSWPHLTVNPVDRTRLQHVPLDIPARALRNTATPGQTNREGRVFQVEIVGFAGKSHTWTGDTLDWLGAEVIGPLAAATGTPLTTSVTFYGEGAGWVLASASARQRLSAAAWDTYTGILGHQHVPENTHWDPGAIDIDRILAAARNLTPTPPAPSPQPGDDDMAALTPEQAAALNRIDLRTDQIQAEVVGKTDADGDTRMDRIVNILVETRDLVRDLTDRLPKED